MDIFELVKENNQEDILNFYNELNEDEKKRLRDDVASIDFVRMNEIYKNRDNIISSDKKIDFAPYIDKSNMKNDEINKYELIGENLIKNGKLAICSMARRPRD